MAGLAFQSTVQYRNRFGRFAALLDAADASMARDMVETTSRLAHEGAPVGPGRDDYGRRPKLSSDIQHQMTSATAGVVGVSGPNSASQETGAVPHPIPNAFGSGETVMHPGNSPQPFIRPALTKLQPLLPAMLRKHYP